MIKIQQSYNKTDKIKEMRLAQIISAILKYNGES